MKPREDRQAEAVRELAEKMDRDGVLPADVVIRWLTTDNGDFPAIESEPERS